MWCKKDLFVNTLGHKNDRFIPYYDNDIGLGVGLAKLLKSQHLQAHYKVT